MTIFESRISINVPAQKIYTFLADLNNHKQLMPDNVENWNATYNTASFSIQNVAKLSLRVENRVAATRVDIVATDNPPFKIELTWILTIQQNTTDVLFKISAELNMMMKMVASGQLQKLADHETEALNAIFAGL